MYLGLGQRSRLISVCCGCSSVKLSSMIDKQPIITELRTYLISSNARFSTYVISTVQLSFPKACPNVIETHDPVGRRLCHYSEFWLDCILPSGSISIPVDFP